MYSTAQAYLKAAKLPALKPNKPQALTPEEGRSIANSYEAAHSDPDNQDTVAAYKSFNDELAAQRKIAEDAGYKFEAWDKPGQPYANSKEMAHDVMTNKHLYYFKSTEGTTPNKLMSLEQNDTFRAVHDLFGHAMAGNQFGPKGETNAFLDHVQMFSDSARKALATETIGQNAWFNFGKANEGKSVAERSFADQKAFLLDPKLYQPLIDRAVRGDEADDDEPDHGYHACPAHRRHYAHQDDWNEEDHPRAEDGKFTDGGGGGGGGDAGTFKGTMYRTSTDFPRTHLPKGKTKDEYTRDPETDKKYSEIVDKVFKARDKKKEDFTDEDRANEKEMDRLSQARRDKEKEWDSEIQKQISYGNIDPKTAQEAGWYMDGHAEQWIPLPDKMWHVTTAADAVAKEGLKTRDELNQFNGKGLGGGPESTISYTDDKNIAKAIHNSMLEFHDLLNDKVSVHDLYDKAVRGEGAKKPWAKEILDSMRGNSGDDTIDKVTSGKKVKTEMNLGGEHPPDETWYDPEAPRKSGLTGEILKDIKGDHVPVPPDKWRVVDRKFGTGATAPYATTWERDLSPFEKDSKKAEFYKAYSYWREIAGGQLDPLFFSTDVGGFKATPRDQIKIMEATPRKIDESGKPIKPMGYRVSSLGEIRSYTGKTVDVKKLEDDRKDEWSEELHPRAENGRFAGAPSFESDVDKEKWITKGGFGIPREKMPQFEGGNQEKFVSDLEDRGYKIKRGTMRVADLLPTQGSMNMEKVNSMYKKMSKRDLAKPILVSSDNHILDGHHRWAALRLHGGSEQIKTIKVDLPIKHLLDVALEHPLATRRTTKDSDD